MIAFPTKKTGFGQPANYSFQVVEITFKGFLDPVFSAPETYHSHQEKSREISPWVFRFPKKKGLLKHVFFEGTFVRCFCCHYHEGFLNSSWAEEITNYWITSDGALRRDLHCLTLPYFHLSGQLSIFIINP